MRRLRTPYAWLLLVYLPLLIGGFFLAFFFTPPIIAATRFFSGLFLGGALLLALSPHGKKLVALPIAPYCRGWRWPGLLLGLQLGLSLLLVLLTQNIIHLLPNSSSAQQALEIAIRTSALPAGFYPWPMYLLFGIALAHFMREEKPKTLIKTSLRPLLGASMDNPFGAGADLLMKQNLFFSAAITLSVSILQISQTLCYWFNLPMDTGLHFNTLLLAMLMSTLFFSRLYLRSTHYLWHNKHFALRNFLPVISIFLIAFIIIFNIAVKISSAFLPGVILSTPHLPFHDPLSWALHWQLFIFIWWLGWTPLAGCFIARLAGGKTLRQIILTGLLFPLGIYLISVCGQQFSAPGRLLFIAHFISLPATALLLAIIAVGLLGYGLQDRLLIRLFSSAGSGKNIQQRVALSVARSFLFLLVGTLIIYLLTNITLLTSMMFGVTIACIAAVFVACLGYGLMLCRQRRQE